MPRSTSAPRAEGLRRDLSNGEDRTVSGGDLVIDRRDWPRGTDSSLVVCRYIAAIGLRSEDTFGVMPSGPNSRDLLLVYRDRPEYAAARQAGAGEAAVTAGMTGSGAPVPAEVSEMLADIGIDLASYGVNVEQRGEQAQPVPPAAGTVVAHGLQWPGTGFLDHWRPEAAAFNFYRELTGLRPEDVYGYVPGGWEISSQGDHWLGFNLIYRDRPSTRPAAPSWPPARGTTSSASWRRTAARPTRRSRPSGRVRSASTSTAGLAGGSCSS